MNRRLVSVLYVFICWPACRSFAFVHLGHVGEIAIRSSKPAVSILFENKYVPKQKQRSTRKTTTLLAINRVALDISNPQYCLTMTLLLSTAGLLLEQRTVWGKALSAPLVTMALALITANIGLVPFTSVTYNIINRYLVPLAVPLLLLDSDLRRVVRDTGSLLSAFGVGAVATCVGTVVAQALLPTVDSRVASALAARHIGGAINFVAVADTLQVSGTAVSAAIAADNVVVALYFAMLFGLAQQGEEVTNGVDDREGDGANQPAGDKSIDLASMATALAVSSTLVTVGGFLTRSLLPTGTSSLPLTSVLTVVLATILPNFCSKLCAAGNALGILMIQMFFAASGFSGSIRLVLEKAPSLFVFSAVQILVHFGVLLSIGKGVFRLPLRELYLASNANVGGPTTAAAMAKAKNWKSLVLPALLVGILGYATATAIALALEPVLTLLK